MAYKVIILYRLYMPSYVLGTFTEYPQSNLFRMDTISSESTTNSHILVVEFPPPPPVLDAKPYLRGNT